MSAPDFPRASTPGGPSKEKFTIIAMTVSLLLVALLVTAVIVTFIKTGTVMKSEELSKPMILPPERLPAETVEHVRRIGLIDPADRLYLLAQFPATLRADWEYCALTRSTSPSIGTAR